MCTCVHNVSLRKFSWNTVRHDLSTCDTVHHSISKDQVLYAHLCTEHQALLVPQAFSMRVPPHLLLCIEHQASLFCDKQYS